MLKESWKVAALGGACALAVGGFAWAQESGSPAVGGVPPDAEEPTRAGAVWPAREPKAGARRGRLVRHVARGELVVVLGGKAHTVAIDRGIVQTVGDGSLTLEELDGAVVTLPVGSETRIRVNGSPGVLEEVEPGFHVLALRTGDGSTRLVRAFRPGQRPGRPGQ